MPNQWNELGTGALQGASNFLTGLFEGQAKKKARETFDLAHTNMQNLLKPITPAPVENAGINPAPTDKSGDLLTSLYNPDMSLGENLVNMPPKTVEEGTSPNLIERTPPSAPLGTGPQGSMYDVFLKGVADLMGQGEYGKPYIPLLQSYYETNIPEKPKVTVADGYLIRYDSNGKLLSKERITEEKQKEYKIGNDWQINDNGDGTYSYYQPTESGWKKTNITASERDYQRQEGIGEFAPKGPSGPHFGIKTPKMNFEDKTGQDLGQQLYSVKAQIEGMGGWNAISQKIQQLSTVDKYADENAYKQAQSDIKNLKLVQDNYTGLFNQLKGMQIEDPDTWAENMGKGVKVNDARQNQQNFAEDFNKIVFSPNAIFDTLHNMYMVDTSQPGGAESLQSMQKGIYDWLGANIYGKVDWSLQNALYDYVNTEMQKIYQSKGMK